MYKPTPKQKCSDFYGESLILLCTYYVLYFYELSLDNPDFFYKLKWHFVKDLCKVYTNKPQHGSDDGCIIQLTVVLVLLHNDVHQKMSPATGHATTLNMLLITKVKVTYSAGFSVRFSSLYKQSAKHQNISIGYILWKNIVL